MLDRAGLRPTPDRVRETLFNWLSLDIPGATVLDCFAGAGALGMEAISRHASDVTLVEIDSPSARHLSAQCQRLKVDNASVFCMDIDKFLQQTEKRFDVVFIDPPYAHADLRGMVIDLLCQRRLLKNGCKIYLEWPVGEKMSLNQPDLHWLKEKTAGQVVYAVAQWGDTG